LLPLHLLIQRILKACIYEKVSLDVCDVPGILIGFYAMFRGLEVAIGIMTFAILVFGEILPKTYCNVNPEKAIYKWNSELNAQVIL